MKIIDKRWKVFGIINIFDLFVICMIVSLSLVYFKWTTTAEDPSFIKSETIRVRCKGIANVSGHVVDLIKEGDTMLGENGDVICRIYKVIEVKPMSQVIYKSKDGEKIFSNSDFMKVTMILDLEAYKRLNEMYFENLGCPVVGGGVVTIRTKKYTTPVTITEFLSNS